MGGSGGQRQMAKLRIQRCGNYDETGHYTRTCLIVVETSKKDDLYGSN
jgi:hypothetical protein